MEILDVPQSPTNHEQEPLELDLSNESDPRVIEYKFIQKSKIANFSHYGD